MAHELFIYWKLNAPQAAAALDAAAVMQRELLRTHPALQARLYRRVDRHGDVVTLMESYAHAGGVDAALQALIAAAAAHHLQPWHDSLRHVETFDAVSAT